MGKCQSQPQTHEPSLSFINNSQSRASSFLKRHKDHPGEQFATIVTDIPVLTKEVQERLQKLGPFKYEHCGKYSAGTMFGPYKLKNDAVYVGQWHNGKIHGKGIYYLPDKSLFEGISVQNYINGFGRIIHSNGDYFEGQLKNGKANGEGVYVEGNITYEGPFKNNLQHGQGVQSSEMYEFRGIFFEGSKRKGRLIIKNKQKYEYEGEFKSNRYHGHGILINDVGRYQGQFNNGFKNGFGKFQWTDGSFYQGQYKNDQKHGKGKLFDKHNKLLRDGIWQNNQILK